MPTPEQIQDSLSQVRNQQSFVRNLLTGALGWQIPDGVERIEDIAYEWPLTDLNAEGLNEQIVNGRIFQINLIDNQPWGIFLLEFGNDDVFRTGRGLTSPLRKILRGLVPRRRGGSSNLPSWNREHLLFICTDRTYNYFRFAYFKSPLQSGHAEPLATFNWGPDTPARTACEFNLPHLAWPQEPENTDQWIAEWAKAFDIETVTKRFYDDYKQVFEELQLRLDLPTPDDKKMFAQVLMNRLMFLRFVERKDWLRLGHTNPKEYLKYLYHAGPLNGLSWYRSRLQVLFFEGLAIPEHNKEHIIGNVPYLNGGLFTKTTWDDPAGDIPDSVFEPILGEHGLLYRYNFTVEESTPLDIEVAVDPEMLGKVFEKLVTDRRNQGSYYTPRTVVSFMCREALKGYLGNQYATLIDEGKTDNITVSDARNLLTELDTVKIVDPACGSGAYLLGMLQELFTLTEKLDTRAQTDDPHTAYQRKLQIICNNIYGVDLDDFAVGIARLRLWLSLAVDYNGDQPEPLPNLDFKIEDGDSLTAPSPDVVFQPDLIRDQQIRAFEDLKAIYMNPQLRVENPEIEQQILELKQQIKAYAHPDENIDGFDWRVEFAEVWNRKGGFDIVIANPPYGATVEDYVRDMYFNRRSEHEKGQSKDTYGLFMARGLQLLRPGGIMSYIISDTWRTIKSHRPLRKRLLDTATVFHIIDLPSWIFDATVNTGIITLQKQAASQEHKMIAADLRGIEDGNWKALSDNLIAISGHGPDIQTLTCARYTYEQCLIQLFSNLPFFIASFQIFQIMNDTSSIINQEGCLPIRHIEINGKTVNLVRFGDDYIKIDNCKVWKNIGITKIVSGIKTGANSIYLKKRVSAGKNLPRIEEHDHIATDEEIDSLSEEEKNNGISTRTFYVPFEMGLTSDVNGGVLPNYYQPRSNYYINWTTASVESMRNEPHSDLANAEFRFIELNEQISFSATGYYAPTFRISVAPIFVNKSSRIFLSSRSRNRWLGFLNSAFARYILKNYINHGVDLEVDDLKLLPTLEDYPHLESYVGTILTNQVRDNNYNYRNEQKQIDNVVYELFSLNEINICDIELWFCRRYRKLAESQGLMAEVKEKYADHLIRCERILSRPPSYWRSNPILQLIAAGESHTVEFKETLEWNVRENRHTDYLNKECLKTIAAFLNADGGTLLIGVSDSGEVKGLSRDLQHVQRRNLDGFERKLRDLIRGHFNPVPTGNITIVFEELAEGTVCKVDIRQSEEVIHFDTEVYIRDGNRTLILEGPDLTRWIQQRNRPEN